jgi:hypothetical protein
MMSSSMQGAMAFQKGLGCVHSLSHSLGGVDPRLHHGTLNAMFLPAVLRFSEGVAPEKYARLKRCFGIAPTADLADAVLDLNARLGIPEKLSGLGVTEDMVEDIVRYASTDLAHFTALKKPTPEEYAALIAATM